MALRICVSVVGGCKMVVVDALLVLLSSFVLIVVFVVCVVLGGGEGAGHGYSDVVGVFACCHCRC